MSGAAPSDISAAGGAAGSASHRQIHHEDLLSRTWRSIAQSVVQVTHKAEKHAADPTNRETNKELNEATVLVLRSRMEWSRSIAYLEAMLEGKAEEMKVLQHYVRSTPRIGRKRKLVEEDTGVAAAEVDTLSAPATVGEIAVATGETSKGS